ncbi:MAG: gamma carbonic anhydrase family protein [Candidatus Riflebacteria bacterium]|nr:gamma carbonic anhydrase family protein [Candidatus Riflebacteria bacterium]
MIKKYKGAGPTIHPSAFLAENTVVIGQVEIGENVSLWYGVSVRGDINRVRIGRDTNIQEQTVIHVDSATEDADPEKGATIIGERVTVGHRALLHACRIGNDCLIGMGAIILSGAEIGDGCIVGAGALVREGQKVPPRSLVVGLPAVVKGSVSDERLAQIKDSARHYMDLAWEYKKAS